ncbi:hypothetical protein ABID59_001710 [Bradyrhizobium sp. S3.3.6]|uniref:Uncharacterized protein n=1 Tax=Bradyrhizobium cytisi TaxID=515489 RepID=A0A5S4WIS1_9BRAD|nr:hypothetical protein [Bradyrhizobium cytisi]TYL80297.1 hypothetical protein FXB38_25425 [Bradyrhizobium cytisi]
MNAIVAIARENVATMGRENDARILRFSDHRIVRATLFRAVAMHVASMTLELLKTLVSKGFRARVAKLSLMLRGPLE